MTVTLCEFLEGLSKGSLKSAGALMIYEAVGAILRHHSQVAGAEPSEARGFLNIAFGTLGKHLSQLLARLRVGTRTVRRQALKNSMRGAKLSFLIAPSRDDAHPLSTGDADGKNPSQQAFYALPTIS